MPPRHAGGEVAAGHAQHDDTVPPVMYSQPWSPTPSTTAVAPELRTQKRSPPTPPEEGLAGDGAVHDGVADDDVFLGVKAAEIGARPDDDAPARRPLPT